MKRSNLSIFLLMDCAFAVKSEKSFFIITYFIFECLIRILFFRNTHTHTHIYIYTHIQSKNKIQTIQKGIKSTMHVFLYNSEYNHIFYYRIFADIYFFITHWDSCLAYEWAELTLHSIFIHLTNILNSYYMLGITCLTFIQNS